MKTCGKCGAKFDGKKLFCEPCVAAIEELFTIGKVDG